MEGATDQDGRRRGIPGGQVERLRRAAVVDDEQADHWTELRAALPN